MFDLVITNGFLVDGTGAAGFKTDIGISGGHIRAIGEISATSETTIDASGMTVAPGFIDLHTHSDGSFLLDPQADSKIRQGVTLELMGNCGMSFCAPLGTPGSMAREHLNDWMARYDHPVKPDWSNIGGYLDALERSGSTLNLAAQVGHGTVRQIVLGMDARAPSADEMLAMERLVAESLAQVAADRDVLYSSHLRSEGADGPGLMTAYEEAIEIGRRTGIRVQISHVKCKGAPAWGRAPTVLELMERSRREGLDIAGDQYPYPRSSTLLTGALFPKWAQEGGREAVLERISDDDMRARVRNGIDYNIGLYEGAQAFAIASYSPESRYEGLTLADIADELGCEPSEAALRVFEGGSAQVVLASLHQDDVDLIATAPFISVASDGNSLRATGVLSAGKPHPRSYGTHARFFDRYVNTLRSVTLEATIHRMTGLPAERLGLTKRGRIAPGYAADVVIFDPANTRDHATFDDPHQYSTGVEHVLVNGIRAMCDGIPTGATPGKVLRSKGS